MVSRAARQLRGRGGKHPRKWGASSTSGTVSKSNQQASIEMKKKVIENLRNARVVEGRRVDARPLIKRGSRTAREQGIRAKQVLDEKTRKQAENLIRVLETETKGDVLNAAYNELFKLFGGSQEAVDEFVREYREKQQVPVQREERRVSKRRREGPEIGRIEAPRVGISQVSDAERARQLGRKADERELEKSREDIRKGYLIESLEKEIKRLENRGFVFGKEKKLRELRERLARLTGEKVAERKAEQVREEQERREREQFEQEQAEPVREVPEKRRWLDREAREEKVRIQEERAEEGKEEEKLGNAWLDEQMNELEAREVENEVNEEIEQEERLLNEEEEQGLLPVAEDLIEQEGGGRQQQNEKRFSIFKKRTEEIEEKPKLGKRVSRKLQEVKERVLSKVPEVSAGEEGSFLLQRDYLKFLQKLDKSLVKSGASAEETESFIKQVSGFSIDLSEKNLSKKEVMSVLKPVSKLTSMGFELKDVDYVFWKMQKVLREKDADEIRGFVKIFDKISSASDKIGKEAYKEIIKGVLQFSEGMSGVVFSSAEISKVVPHLIKISKRLNGKISQKEMDETIYRCFLPLAFIREVADGTISKESMKSYLKEKAPLLTEEEARELSQAVNSVFDDVAARKGIILKEEKEEVEQEEEFGNYEDIINEEAEKGEEKKKTESEEPKKEAVGVKEEKEVEAEDYSLEDIENLNHEIFGESEETEHKEEDRGFDWDEKLEDEIDEYDKGVSEGAEEGEKEEDSDAWIDEFLEDSIEKDELDDLIDEILEDSIEEEGEERRIDDRLDSLINSIPIDSNEFNEGDLEEEKKNKNVKKTMKATETISEKEQKSNVKGFEDLTISQVEQVAKAIANKTKKAKKEPEGKANEPVEKNSNSFFYGNTLLAESDPEFEEKLKKAGIKGGSAELEERINKMLIDEVKRKLKKRDEQEKK